MIWRNSIAVVAARIILGLVFVYAAYTKLRQPWLVFAMSIDAYQILPENGVLAVARVVPWLELAIGILLLSGYWLGWAAPAATLLLLTFFGIMVRAWFQGRGIDCGCFGVGEALSGWTLARDGALLAMSIGLTFFAALAGLRLKPRLKTTLPQS